MNLFYWIFWAAIFVVITVGGILLYTVIRFRRRPGDPDPPQIHGNTPLEIGWTLAPAIVLAVVAVPTVTTIFDNANSPLASERGGMEIEVVGHQWWWEFKYRHPEDPEARVVTANELHIPVNEVVNVKLESKDVIHSFWIPKLAGKVDLVPNSPNSMWIKADEPGEYLGQCAEFCGVAHALMRFRVFAEPREEFEAWLRAEAGPAAEPAEPMALEGKSLLEDAAQCWACHAVSGSKRAKGSSGPNLTHLASRGRIGAGLADNTQANLRLWIEDPANLKPGTIMARDAQVYTDADKALTDSEVSAIVAYLRTLK